MKRSILDRQLKQILLGYALVVGVASSVTLSSFGAESSTNGLLLVANKGDHTLSIIDSATTTELAAVAEDGITGHEVVASVDGKRAFVPIFGNSGVGKPGTDGQLIRVIDLGTHAVIGTIDFGRGVRPHCAVLGPKTGLLYVTTEIDNAVAIIDPKTLKIIGAIPTSQPESHMLAVTKDERKGYTANVGPGTVSVLDLSARKTLKIIPIAKTTQRISLTPDDHWVFTADQNLPRLAVIDTGKDEVVRWIELPGLAYGTAATPDSRWLVVAFSGLNQVGFVDLQSMKLTKTLPLPRFPQEVLVRPDGAVAYVSCDASAQVAAIDLRDFTTIKLIKAGNGADGLAWARR